MGELIEWLQAHTAQTTDDEPYVLNFRHSDIGDPRTDFQYVVSTPRLLKIATEFKIICADGTYKLNELRRNRLRATITCTRIIGDDERRNIEL